MMQSAANHSPRFKFPVKQGINREFPRFRPSWDRLAAEKALSTRKFVSEFPTQRNRELFWRNREFSRPNREFDSESREGVRGGVIAQT
jgi:hypothetical protein